MIAVSESEMRFSDEQLVELRKDVSRMADRQELIERRMEEYEGNEEKWRAEMLALQDHQTRRYDALLEMQERNTVAITGLTSQVSAVVSDTKDIVQLQKDIQGAARIGKGVQAFMLWLLKWGAIGSGTYAAVYSLIEHWRS